MIIYSFFLLLIVMSSVAFADPCKNAVECYESAIRDLRTAKDLINDQYKVIEELNRKIDSMNSKIQELGSKVQELNSKVRMESERLRSSMEKEYYSIARYPALQRFRINPTNSKLVEVTEEGLTAWNIRVGGQYYLDGKGGYCRQIPGEKLNCNYP